MLALLRGIMVGLAVAMPVGPVALLCMRRTLGCGIWRGYLTGLGAAMADTAYAAVSVFGVAALVNLFTDWEDAIRLTGGVLMLGIAIRVALSPPKAMDGSEEKSSMTGSLISGFLLTLTNPLTLMAFMVIFASIGSLHHSELNPRLYSILLLVGIFLGAAGWWGTLCLGVARLRHLINDTIMKRVNFFLSIALGLFGVYTVCAVLWSFLSI
ncbi:MAG: LysE family translocator [Alphaproteobacteria bacterium]